MTPRKIFSVPLNPKLNYEQFFQFNAFCSEYKDWISDIYFTCRIPPFDQDAMGDVIFLSEDKMYLIETAVDIQKRLGIPVSATFNNIQVPPTQRNLDTFIVNFKKLYDMGVRIVTIPHTHWVATGQIKAAFPEIYIKNTILRDVHTAQEIVNLAKYGFDYINLDRDLMRDKDKLLQIKKAKEYIRNELGRDISISLLANEGCLGACPMMVEHFEFNNNRSGNTPQYFNDPISRTTCPKWDVEDPAIALKTANFSPWKEDWDEYINELGIDVFKMHGREDIGRLHETMELVSRYAAGEKYVDPSFEQWCAETELSGRPIELWREKIRNCKFECWECQYCDKIYEKKSDLEFPPVVRHVVDSIAQSGIPTVFLDIPGLTSPRVQTLLNLLAKKVGTYMEIGSYLGSTASAVLKDNMIKAVFIDSWQENIQPKTDQGQLPPTSKEVFLNNLEKYKNKSAVFVHDCDMFEAPLWNYENSIQMFFYDGPHDRNTTKQAFMNYYSVFSDQCIIIVDDANWKETVEGAVEGIEESGGRIIYQRLLLNDEEDKTMWWNGLFICVVKK